MVYFDLTPLVGEALTVAFLAHSQLTGVSPSVPLYTVHSKIPFTPSFISSLIS